MECGFLCTGGKHASGGTKATVPRATQPEAPPGATHFDEQLVNAVLRKIPIFDLLYVLIMRALS